jgi:hypothetical protein
LIGLCHSCRSSGVEVVVDNGEPVCKACVRRGEVAQESHEKFKTHTLGDEVEI